MIKIAQKLRPFSHVPGTHVLIPKSSLSAQIFPTRIILIELTTNKKMEVQWDLHGSFEDFTIVQDLERLEVRVFARAQEGYFRFRLTAKKEGLSLFIERSPKEIAFTCNKKKKVLKEKEEWTIGLPTILFAQSKERLSLGSHKKQDWDLVKRREDMREVLPIWLRLSVPRIKTPKVGTASLLERGRIEKNEAEKYFQNLFQIGFKGILVPRLMDDQHQGIVKEEPLPKDANPLVLLSEGGHLIRSLFFRVEEHKLFLLPTLPKEFAFGRFVNLSSDWGEFDLEWSKKILRKAVFRAKKTGRIELVLQKQIQNFRVRKSHRDKGKTFSRETPLLVEEDHTYILDRFQK